MDSLDLVGWNGNIGEDIELVLAGFGGGSRLGGTGDLAQPPTEDFRIGGGGGIISPGLWIWSW